MSNGKTRIVVTELPYQVNKARLIEKIATLVREKKVDGITDLRDESDKSGMRVVIECRRDADPHVMLNRLYKHSQLEDTFGVIMLALWTTSRRFSISRKR
jgi:DNA gyrase subunit A